MIKKLINKFKEYKNRITWLELLDDGLFYTDEGFSDIILASAAFESLNLDSENIINFICYSDNFIYVPHFDKESKNNNRFDIYPLSQLGYDCLNNFKPTLH